MQLNITADLMEQKINNAPVLVSVMQEILKRNQIRENQREHFWIVGLDQGNNLNFIELVALGNHERIKMTSTDVLRVAIIKGAPKLILVHNHPSHSLNPSIADKHTTLFLIRIAEMIGIEVIDHIIISSDDYFSFAEDGLLDEIKLSDEYQLLDTVKYERLKSELHHEGKVEAQFEERILITKNLVELGIDKEIIIKATGLDPQLV
jgi:DNA repair protein RadC